MAILITGASGFVGRSLLPLLLEKGHKLYGLSRHPPDAKKNLISLSGDITKPNLGIDEVPKDIHAIYHLAGSHDLGWNKETLIRETNINGTLNVLDFCVRYDIPRLYFTSTAYTVGRNPYEISKIINEENIIKYQARHGLKTTIFKPSIIMGTPENPYPGHFSQFVSLLIKFLLKAGVIKTRIEDMLKLPTLEIVHRVKGDPEGKLNIITVDVVVKAMASIDTEGTFWLTNPNPPSLRQLAEWISEYIMIDFRILPEFKPTPLETKFMKMVNAFGPYLQGDKFPSEIESYPPISKDFIHATITHAIKR